MTEEERTNYVYEFTYNSGPGLREIFQCKFVSPDEALMRFRRILALTDSPFDFKIVVQDESKGEESSFQVKGGSIDEMFEKPAPLFSLPIGMLLFQLNCYGYHNPFD